MPLGRLGDPAGDIAGAVAALARPDFAYLTGATLMLDGGRPLLPSGAVSDNARRRCQTPM